mmetsp:Transcript_12150/g.45189  ORF Transcript_12150/g.45189 Transcript_12150/m.45189 type:complete len:205 (-) Transcript_12150:3685-4299(-)
MVARRGDDAKTRRHSFRTFPPVVVLHNPHHDPVTQHLVHQRVHRGALYPRCFGCAGGEREGVPVSGRGFDERRRFVSGRRVRRRAFACRLGNLFRLGGFVFGKLDSCFRLGLSGVFSVQPSDFGRDFRSHLVTLGSHLSTLGLFTHRLRHDGGLPNLVARANHDSARDAVFARRRDLHRDPPRQPNRRRRRLRDSLHPNLYPVR